MIGEKLAESALMSQHGAERFFKYCRAGWALASVVVVGSLVVGLSILPAISFWDLLYRWPLQGWWLRPVLLSMWFVPAYLIFSVSLMVLAAGATRLLGWRTPANVEMSVESLEWPILRWIRYAVITQVVRLLVGMAFRATPLWSLYMRLNGARMGRRVYVRSLELSDHNLLEFGDDVIVGANAHISGHTVEGGYVITAPVRLGNNVTVGLGSVVGIGVEVGDNAQIGALSLVPKHRRLDGDATWVGIPVSRLRDQPDR